MFKRFLVILAVLGLLTAMVPAAAAVVAGAGFTTTNAAVDGPDTCFNGPGIVNCNIYEQKQHVWINGGPTNGANQLSDGTYFFVVGVPGGENSDINDAATVPDDGTGTPQNLSDDFDAYTNRTFTVAGGKISAYAGTHDSYWTGTQLLIRLAPYSDTTNPGGVYFVGICRIDEPATAGYPAEPSQCKYDNFKVRAGGVVVEHGVASGLKYYDANVNGQWDPGEPGISGWPIDVTGGLNSTIHTGAGGTFSLNLDPGSFHFVEQQANSPWMQTGNTVDQTISTGGNSATLNVDMSYDVTVANGGSTTGLNFGNVCVGAGGGHTLGFWSNKNGEKQMRDNSSLEPELLLLRNLNLRNANGTNFDPTTYAQFRTWLLAATADNMAYMLSAQLAAMALNVEAGFVSASALVWNGGAFVTINAVMADADASLGAHGLTPAGHPERAYQEALKNTLDNANNNLNFLQPTPATCPAPVFP